MNLHLDWYPYQKNPQSQSFLGGLSLVLFVLNRSCKLFVAISFILRLMQQNAGSSLFINGRWLQAVGCIRFFAFFNFRALMHSFLFLFDSLCPICKLRQDQALYAKVRQLHCTRRYTTNLCANTKGNICNNTCRRAPMSHGRADVIFLCILF